MLDPILLKNLITKKERNVLQDWIIKNKDSEWFMWSGHQGTKRRTTRFSDHVVYPNTAFEVRDRIKKLLNINTNFYPNYPDGMVASYGLKEDECEVHTDPTWFDNHKTFHCVVLLSASEKGGIPIINGLQYSMSELDGLYYSVSDIPHSTTKTSGDKPRILWIFGFSILNL